MGSGSLNYNVNVCRPIDDYMLIAMLWYRTLLVNAAAVLNLRL